MNKILVLAGIVAAAIVWQATPAAALPGDATSVLPNTGIGSPQPWAVVTTPGGNGMDAKEMSIYAYVPVPAGGGNATFNLTISDACGQTSNDQAGWNTFNKYTDFRVTSSVRPTSVTIGGDAVVATNYATNFWNVSCLSETGSIVLGSITANDTAHTVLTLWQGGVEKRYYRVRVSAEVNLNGEAAKGGGNSYVNRFRFSSSTDGVLLGYTYSPASPGTTTEAYTGVAYGGTLSNGFGFDINLSFAPACNAANTTRSVWFYDTDNENTNSKPDDPFWQSNGSSYQMTYVIEKYHRGSTGAFIENVASGQLQGGNNVADQTEAVTFDSQYKYRIVVKNINHTNTIQVALPYEQVYASSDCLPPDAATCTFSGTAVGDPLYINEPFTVTVNFRNAGSNTWNSNYNYGPTNGSTYTAITPNIAPGATLTKDITWTPTTVGANREFTWRVRNGNTNFGDECKLTRDVRYRPPLVTCTVTPPGTLEAGTQANAELVVTYDSPSTPSGATAASTGSITARSLSNGIADTPPAITYDPAAIPTSISRGIGGVSFTVSNVNIGSPGQMTWTGSATVATSNGVGGTYTVNAVTRHADGTTSPGCGGSSLAADLPYIKEFGGDVWAGGSFDGTCQPPANQGAIYAFNRQDGSSQYVGASAQHTVTALLRITNYHSVSKHNTGTAGLNAYPPKGLSFANYSDSTVTGVNTADRNSANSVFGGGYGDDNGKCMTDFYGATQDASIRQPGSFPPTTSGTVDPRDNPRIVAVPTTHSAGHSLAVRPNTTYTVRSTGDYAHGAYDIGRADASCVGTQQLYNTPPETEWSVWKNSENPTDLHELELRINDQFMTWTPIGAKYGSTNCSVSHTYETSFTTGPTTTTMKLAIYETFDPDWYADNNGTLSVTVTPNPLPLPPPIVASPPLGRSQYWVSGDLTLTGSTFIPFGVQTAVYVDGDVYIGGDINLADGNYTSVDDIPFFAIIARGNIYIDKAVRQIDGMFVAQPNGSTGGVIYTCARGNAMSPAAFTYSSTPAEDIYQQCGTQLSVNGSLIAKRIKFLRTYQSLRGANFAENPDFANGRGTNAAEVVNYLPRMWLAPSPLRDPNTPENGGEPYDAIRALPPVY